MISLTENVVRRIVRDELAKMLEEALADPEVATMWQALTEPARTTERPRPSGTIPRPRLRLRAVGDE
jgi:hypothetical protein